MIEPCDNQSQVLSFEDGVDSEMGRMKEKVKKYTCQECDYAAAKPALLIQHLRSHSEQKPFSCPMSGCSCTYKRQDHLNRHMKVHEGRRFSCPEPGCDQSFSLMTNLQRHLKLHEQEADFPRPKSSGEKKYKCLQPGCEKSFLYPSMLRTHQENVHEKLVYAEVICVYPGCGEKFPNERVLLGHAVQAHPYLLCEVCGETISRKSYRRHVRNHGSTQKPVKVTCPYEGCTHHYSRETNLRLHIESYHLKLKPYVCPHDACGKSFPHNCSRHRHELSALHVHTGTDFEEEEQKFTWMSKGGRKKVRLETVEDLYIKKSKFSQDPSVGAKNRDHQDASDHSEESEGVDDAENS